MKRRLKRDTPPESRKFTLDRRRFLWCVGAAVLLGVVLRLWVAIDFSAMNGGANNMLSPSRVTDMATYIDLADKIVSGTYRGEFYYQPFYYAVFLPLVRISGGGVWSVALLQILLGGATIWLVGLIGEKLVGRAGGVLAAWLTALSPALMLYAPFHLNETLQAFNITLFFYLALVALARCRWYWWALCGAVAAVATLTRGNAILLVIPVAALGVFHAVGDKARRWQIAGYAAVFAAALLLVELPFIWHNTRVTGRLTGPSTASGAVLALGNTPEAPPGGREPGLPAGPMEYPESWHRMMKLQQEGVSVPRQMWEWFAAEPGAFLELQFRKALLFWDGREIPNNVSLYGEGRMSPVLRVFSCGINLLVAFAVAGALLMLTRLKRGAGGIWLLYGFVVIYWLSIALFYDLSRFRAPILPLAAVFAGGVVWWWGKAVLTRERVLRLAAALLAALWLTGFSYEFYRSSCEVAVMRLVRPDGTKILDRDGKPWVFDHGPLTFGGWREVPLETGMTWSKRFAVPASAGMLRLKVFAETPGVLKLDAGEHPLHQGENDLEFPLRATDDGTFRFTVLDASGNAALVLDVQRDYGRTLINGEKAPGELVARFSPVL